MQTLTPADLLQLWEAGSEQTLIERSLLLLAKALPEQTPSSLAMLSIGERDEMLLCLREYLFGTKLKNTAACPKCADIVEWESSSRDMHLQPVPPLPANSVLEFVKEGVSIKYRLPNSTDLLKVIRNANSYIADPNKLLTGCIIDIQHNSEAIQVKNLDVEILQALEIQISNDDPQADIGMVLNCPVCSNQWEAKFDILSYLWTEIDVWGTHLLHEVYLLASAFGWAERDILNMSPQRRTMYVKLIQA